MPYGVGFDNEIKARIEEIDVQKIQNNKIMDELIQKIGYLDYRDALACNKYIIEAKKHSNLH